MKRLPREEAIQAALAPVRARYDAMTKDELIEKLLGQERCRLEDLPIHQLANAVSNRTNGEFSAIRTDLGDTE